MKVLVVGGGGREHAICWKLAQSPRLWELHCAPGNPGIAQVATCHAVGATDIPGQVALARELGVDLVVVGPEDPLALGMVDELTKAGIKAFGPTQAAARLEWSKAFAKQVMLAAGVPTARYASFTAHAAALAYVREHGAPIVVKADGLAAGKGVYVCQSVPEAEQALHELMVGGVFGATGATVVIEEFMVGEEVSVLALVDGETIRPFPAAQDHKPVGEGDTGPNTGGMGTYSPVPAYTPEIANQVYDKVLVPTVTYMREAGTPFVGCLFAGLMLTASGPKVVEFNARFGDPETQSVLALLESDLLDLFEACVEGRLHELSMRVREGGAACVILASGGYPGPYEKGKPIAGLDEAERRGALVFHAGTAEKDGQVVTNGGRVLGVVGRGPNVKQALASAYHGVEAIRFEGRYARRDIGWRVFR